MKIENLKVSNFRSFDRKGIDYHFQSGMNVIVGENGSGKSNIVHALAAFGTILKEGQSLSKEDFFEGKSNMPVG